MGENEQTASSIMYRRMRDREEWDCYWKLRYLDSEGTFYPRISYHVSKFIDYPVTLFKEKIVEPLRDRNRLPYYHRKISRAPGIDQCAVNDLGCIYEANQQFRLDKMVDGYILKILYNKAERCMGYADRFWHNCAQQINDFEESELNFFIKYGELGSSADVRDAYMKQKHRKVWERRHPEIMAERQAALERHKQNMAQGEFDMSFWKKGLFYQDKKRYEPPYELELSKASIEGDKPLSKDWEYYKKVKEDPEFDKKQGKTTTVRIF